MDLVAFAEELTGSKLLEGKEKEQRMVGMDWPINALTMVGDVRLANLKRCIETVVQDNVNGDVIECGVWRGGACIYARAVLNELGSKKKVVVADSFEGLPQPDMKFPGNENCDFWNNKFLSVSLEEVKNNFQRYQLLEDVEFVKGWFNITLPMLLGPFAIIRVDGDLFESVMVTLDALYSKLSVGGFVILDEYMKLPSCRNAVEIFRWKNNIKSPIEIIDHSGAYWRKS
jgi:O-methyltransferase